MGTDALNYFLPFLDLAPLQCTGLGKPQTSGIPNLDYFVSSSLVEPESAQENYSEKLYLMPGLPLSCATSPGVGNSNCSIEMHCPGAVITLACTALLLDLDLHGRQCILP